MVEGTFTLVTKVWRRRKGEEGEGEEEEEEEEEKRKRKGKRKGKGNSQNFFFSFFLSLLRYGFAGSNGVISLYSSEVDDGDDYVFGQINLRGCVVSRDKTDKVSFFLFFLLNPPLSLLFPPLFLLLNHPKKSGKQNHNHRSHLQNSNFLCLH